MKVQAAPVGRLDGMTEGTADAAQRRRRKYRRQEWIEQVKLAQLLAKYLDPCDNVLDVAGKQAVVAAERRPAKEARRAVRASRHDGRLSSAAGFRRGEIPRWDCKQGAEAGPRRASDRGVRVVDVPLRESRAYGVAPIGRGVSAAMEAP
jgi:hypothetical protein